MGVPRTHEPRLVDNITSSCLFLADERPRAAVALHDQKPTLEPVPACQGAGNIHGGVSLSLHANPEVDAGMQTTKKLLRALAGAELWRVEDVRGGQRRPTIRYVVKSAGDERIFTRPHEAWRHFQQLTNAPDRDVRPEPPPIDPEQLNTSRPRKRRRRKPPSNN